MTVNLREQWYGYRKEKGTSLPRRNVRETFQDHEQDKRPGYEYRSSFTKNVWSRGYRYRKNLSGLPGRPDIALTRYKIAIFCDSEFFHGKDWDNLKIKLNRGSNPEYWITSKGLEGKKGVLWWDIRDMLEAKAAPFVLLENVDRLLKSPASQRGRDFAIILACFRDLDYTVEWRVINAADYGYQQRRRRTFIFAYKNDTKYNRRIEGDTKYSDICGDELHRHSIAQVIEKEGFFAKSFPVTRIDAKKIKMERLPIGIGELSQSFKFDFENAGVMKDGVIYTIRTAPDYSGKQITLGDIMEDGKVDKAYFIDPSKMYYTTEGIDHSDETLERLPVEKRQTWQYIKGAKKLPRKAANGHEYVFSEGPVPLFDEYDKPARTMLTSEGSFNRSTHVVKDKKTGKPRLLTPVECESIQGFPSDWTKECLVDGEKVEMPANKRRFMMGNALVVNLIKQMEKQLSIIFDEE